MRQYSGLERLEAALVEMGQGMSYAATPNFEPKVPAAQERARAARLVPALRVATPRLILIIALALALLAAVAASAYYAGVRLVGFVPGVGYVELDETLILAEPVAVERGGLTVQVDQVVANPEGTRIQYSISPFFPLPDEGQAINPYNLPVDPGLTAEPKLLLSDGSVLSAEGGGWAFMYSGDPNETRAGFVATGGHVNFDAPPTGANEVTLVLNCIPVQPWGFPPFVDTPYGGRPAEPCIPGPWRVALRLVPATEERLSGALIQPYDPQASASANGVTMRVQRVAHGGQETAVELQFVWDDPAWRFPGAVYASDLQDDLGHRYFQLGNKKGGMTEIGCVWCANVVTQDTPSGQVMSEVQTLAYAPLSNKARQLSLTIEALEFSVPASVEFSIDLGPDPQIGQTWPLDQILQVSGFEVHLFGARLTEEEGLISVELFFKFKTEELTDSSLTGFSAHPSNAPSFVGGCAEEDQTRCMPRWAREAAAGYRGIMLSIETNEMPHGRQSFVIGEATIGLRGPWQVTWPIPSAELQLQSGGGETPSPFFIGAWESTDSDGSYQTLSIEAEPSESHRVTYHDVAASACGLDPDMGILYGATASGLFEASGDTLFGSMDLYCQTSPPAFLDSIGFSFTYDATSDKLRDGWGVVWTRK